MQFFPCPLGAYASLLAVLLTGCTWQMAAQSPEVATTTAAPSPVATVAAVVAAAPSPSRPPLMATATVPIPATPTAVLTSSPTATATETATPEPTFTATADPVDRTCPYPPPAKPEYQHYYLHPRFWPTPDPAGAEDHFWLSSPLLMDGRPRLADHYPYGFDGSGRYLLHNGVDFIEPLGTLTLAVADGTIVVAQSDREALYGWRCDWYGHLVVLELTQRWQGQPVYVLYGHVLNIMVEPGQQVQRGQPIAEIGVGGATIAPHLHLEVRLGSNEFGATRNPNLWLDPGSSRGVIAGRLIDPEGRPWQGVFITAVGRSQDTSSRSTWSYLGDPLNLINPDEQLAENFVIPDLLPGRYQLYVALQGVEYTAFVDVAAGQISPVEIVTEPYKGPAPSPSETPANSLSTSLTVVQPNAISSKVAQKYKILLPPYTGHVVVFGLYLVARLNSGS